MSNIFRKYKEEEVMSEELKTQLYIEITNHTTKSFQYSKDWVNTVYMECLRNKDFSDENIKKECKKAESRKISQSRDERGMKRVTVTDEHGNKSRQWRKVIPSTITIETFEHSGINIDCINEFSEEHPYLNNSDGIFEHHDECDNYY